MIWQTSMTILWSKSWDVTDFEEIDALADKYQDTPIDVLINNAGILGAPENQTLGNLDYETFQDVMAVNLFGPLKMADAFLEHVAASEQKKNHYNYQRIGFDFAHALPRRALLLSNEQGGREYGNAQPASPSSGSRRARRYHSARCRRYAVAGPIRFQRDRAR